MGPNYFFKVFMLLFWLVFWSSFGNAAEKERILISPGGRIADTQNNPVESRNSCAIQGSYDLKALQSLLPKLSRLSKAGTEDLPKMLERKTVRILTTYSMTNYFVIRGQSYGYEYSLLKEYERFLNQDKMHRNQGIVMEFFPIPEKMLIPSLRKGLGDIVAAGLTTTPRFERETEFTDHYLSGIRDVIVYNKNLDNITQISDLAGKQIYVRPNQNFYETLTEINNQLIARNLPPVRIVKANEFLTTKDILELVNAGIIDFSLAENHLAERWADVMPHLKISSQLVFGRDAGLGWLVRKNNPELKASLNDFIKAHKKGTFYGNLYFKRYFKNAEWIKNPLNQDDIVKFSRYAPLFKKYGRMYNIDWMLLAALAYQESRLDQNRQSHAGAIGLMQVLPSTAQDAHVRVNDIHLPENNVHAGTKYLAMLRDHYLNEENIPSEERIRFALAAYNAGPSKIKRCRQVAETGGYDPNRWFRHTEMGAHQVIGLETPRYVSNITKYYLAYRLSNTLDCLKNKQLEKLNRMYSSTRH